MIQRIIQLNQHERSLVHMLVLLNSIYTLFSTFEGALTNREKLNKYLGIWGSTLNQ